MPRDKWPSDLLEWFLLNQRQMPWRSDPQPYFVWVSEVMLQQTQVVTVIPYFERFISRFPTPFALAKADLSEVLKLWEGLGYYSRARCLHRAMQEIVSSCEGVIPSDYEHLQTFPGMGPYCAAAVSSIAFDRPVPVVDGNVIRVFCRFFGVFEDSKSPAVRKELFSRLSEPIQTVRPSLFNQAMMELGALICTPKSPSCSSCPLSEACYAYQNQKIEQLPVVFKKPPTPHYDVVVGLFYNSDQQLLVVQRDLSKMLGGLWELPGGKVLPSLSLESSLSVLFQEKYGLTLSSVRFLSKVKHAYTHFKITVHAFEVSSNSCVSLKDPFQFVSLEAIHTLPFSKATLKIFLSIS